jgi:hypothetical protein
VVSEKHLRGADLSVNHAVLNRFWRMLEQGIAVLFRQDCSNVQWVTENAKALVTLATGGAWPELLWARLSLCVNMIVLFSSSWLMNF